VTVSFARWFGRLQVDTRAEPSRYYPQRELLHRLSLTLIRCSSLEETVPDLLSQAVLASGLAMPIWLAWRTTPDTPWNLHGTGSSASALEIARLQYQLDLATRGNRYQLQPEDTLARESVMGLRVPDGQSGLQLWLLSPYPESVSMECWRQLLRDMGQAVREGLDIRMAHEQQQTALRQEIQQTLAASLHDSVAQQLCYLCLQTGRLEQQAEQLAPKQLQARLQDIRCQTRQAYRQTRELISSARIRLQHSLEQELLRAIAEFEQHSSLMFELDNRLSGSNLPEPVAVELLLIVREALSNAVRHAHAHRMRIQLLPHNGSGFHVRIEDDGQGLPAQRNADSFGLGIMEERARRIGARFQLTSTPGNGTCIELIAEELCP
jgi:nitrate/nitrite-specific signal transduction histidine kinase